MLTDERSIYISAERTGKYFLVRVPFLHPREQLMSYALSYDPRCSVLFAVVVGVFGLHRMSPLQCPTIRFLHLSGALASRRLVP
jgi:hypothetical protein